ncbi:hypothetical protein LRS13_01860 [Svornostia abyssi]|uniref:Uncharacterized protein n=1 Tax=Svornostia abyssi TaxID=2898438 RepID=A0ABY5PIB3_9ACTN|nr:hypothetical protein LRS13_01860 [Parviterribacteraceae bacterium J379]
MQYGIDHGYCDWSTAVGRAELELAGNYDQRVLALAIADGSWEALSILREMCGPISDRAETDAQRCWQFLVVAWIAEGHPEPGPDPAHEGAPRDEVLESVWVEFGYCDELSFAAPWGEQLGPGELPSEDPTRPRWPQIEPRVGAWLADEGAKLRSAFPEPG